MHGFIHRIRKKKTFSMRKLSVGMYLGLKNVGVIGNAGVKTRQDWVNRNLAHLNCHVLFLCMC